MRLAPSSLVRRHGLTGHETQGMRAGRFQVQQRALGAQVLDALHGGANLLRRELRRTLRLVGLHHQIGDGGPRAGEDIAVFLFMER